jgi:uncharacterized protein
MSVRSLVAFIPATIISIIIIVIMAIYTKSALSIYYVLILAALELALSFDNAVVNARVLNKLTPIWQNLFLWVGLPIAVFGMRFLFPLILVYFTTDLSFSAVAHKALYYPDEYTQSLNLGMPLIGAFGACFLFMVFVSFLLEPHTNHWLKFLEQSFWIKALRKYFWSPIVIGMIVCLIIWLISYLVYARSDIALSALFGLIAHQILHLLNMYLGREKSAKNTFASGLIGFCYLEVLDASFSFDGVLGAFAITQDILIIFAGLGIGALYVRSMTIYLVRHKVLAKFKYLEHGAHYAIGFLAIMLFIKIFGHIPEWIIATGSIGIVILSVLPRGGSSKIG